MKTSMTLGGIGPNLALLCLPYVVLSLIVMHRYPEFFDLSFLDFPYVKVFGFVWLGTRKRLYSLDHFSGMRSDQYLRADKLLFMFLPPKTASPYCLHSELFRF
jgi:hypothetical protein